MQALNEPIAKQVLGSKLKRRILAFLLSGEGSVSERELAKRVGASHTAVNKSLKQLLEMNVVYGRSIGNARVWELNKESLAYPFIDAVINASRTTPLDYIKQTLKQDLEMLNSETEELRKTGKNDRPWIEETYIFGSAVEGTAKAESDVDILIILERKNRIEVLKRILIATTGIRVLEKTGNRLSIHIYDRKDVQGNKPPWIRKAISAGIRVI